MSLPRYTEVDRLSSVKMTLERLLMQVHNLYPAFLDLYFKNFYMVFDWTIKELIRLNNYREPNFNKYRVELVERLDLNEYVLAKQTRVLVSFRKAPDGSDFI